MRFTDNPGRISQLQGFGSRRIYISSPVSETFAGNALDRIEIPQDVRRVYEAGVLEKLARDDAQNGDEEKIRVHFERRRATCGSVYAQWGFIVYSRRIKFLWRFSYVEEASNARVYALAWIKSGFFMTKIFFYVFHIKKTLILSYNRYTMKIFIKIPFNSIELQIESL